MIEVLFDRVAIKRDEFEQVSKGGLIIPTQAQNDPPVTGIVVAVGNEVKVLKVNDKIIFSKFTGIGVSYAGEDVVVMKEEEVLARVTL